MADDDVAHVTLLGREGRLCEGDCLVSGHDSHITLLSLTQAETGNN